MNLTDTSIATFSGRILDLASPKASDIAIEDIVAGLSKVCRFGGQSLRFYSVAQHAVAVSLTVQHLGRGDLALAALHHDSHEAYTCDVPRPLKQLLNPGYTEITNALDQAIAEHLGIKLAALHHDSHEAYTCDVPRPLKQLLNPGYTEITNALDQAIAEHLGIKLPAKGTSDGDLVKAADDAVLRVEAGALLHGGVEALGPVPEPDGDAAKAARAGASGTEHPWTPETAAENFLQLHDGLANQ